MDLMALERIWRLPELVLAGSVNQAMLDQVHLFIRERTLSLPVSSTNEVLIIGDMLTADDDDNAFAADRANSIRETLVIAQRLGMTIWFLARGTLFTPGILIMSAIPLAQRVTTASTQFVLEQEELSGHDPTVANAMGISEAELASLFEEDTSNENGNRMLTFFGQRAHELRLIRELI